MQLGWDTRLAVCAAFEGRPDEVFDASGGRAVIVAR